ncbi:hypothetical protein M8756_16510 [Lutimaribacter sp. EGI FJ00015]|uniref:Uncharacterized protein n=1 Tax=Lutimaribacter degradans TaxID=2945989 RepID=A0ACC6A0N1_9RHOB|nr:hypothetical protein [Lutimaribacter sp. EGI FJ00013]MCM2563733.1 hypothetical protein [Lutimaribacter sp. EGI FJ00013]MCO0614917.1 hypothetical protein [Lutimaribacter sp. EGI FJ00015]MCO0637601.1 hypothetical protein [Lutimaribacter sp. EGI FJ00014]
MTVQEGATTALPWVLDSFRQRFAALRVDPVPLDVTDAFWSDAAGRYVAPRAYGALPQARVIGYAAFGGALISKYQKDAGGRVVRDAGIPRIRRFSVEQVAMACLCLSELRNTSLYEIGDALEGTHRLQGYRRWHLRRLTASIRSRHPGFAPSRDSFFLFAGTPEHLTPRIALNALWLRQIVNLGSGALRRCSPGEAALMQAVFPQQVLNGEPASLRAHGYMWNRPLWEPRSAEFLAAKVAARHALLTRSGI